MKKNACLLLLLSLLYFGNTQAQNNTTTSPWFIDLNAGFNKPVETFASPYHTSTPNLYHIDLGVRYMFNDNFGLKLDYGHDYFKNAPQTPEFTNTYNRVNAQGVIDLGNMLNFSSWTSYLGLQAHTGLGISTLGSQKYGTKDKMINHIIGITGQIKLSKSIAINGDLSMLNHLKKSYTFDGNLSNPSTNSFNGTLYNATIGLSVNLGNSPKSLRGNCCK